MSRTRTSRRAALVLAVGLAPAVLSASPAAAGTTWSSLSTAAVTATSNGVTWKNLPAAAVERAEGTAPVELAETVALAWGSHPGVPHCSDVSAWQRFLAALGVRGVCA